MIGVDEFPSEIREHRLCRNGSPEAWRASWDQDDNSRTAELGFFQKSHSLKNLNVSSIRTNLSSISIIRRNDGWLLLWDERFFDYLILQLGLLHQGYDAAAQIFLCTTLFRYMAENYAVDDPHYCLTLLDAAEQIPRSSVEPQAPSPHAIRWLKRIFGVVRQFVLFHECAHIALKDPIERQKQTDNFRVVLDDVRRNAPRNNLMSPEALKTLQDIVATESADPSAAEEMMADIMSLSFIMKAELMKIDLNTLGHSNKSKEITAALAGIYEAIMLLYFMTSTMNSLQEYFRPKSIRHHFEFDQFKSISLLSARADIRGRLWAIMMHQELSYDIKRINLVRSANLGFRDIYMQTQFRIIDQLKRGFDRKRLLGEAVELRAKKSQDAVRDEARQSFMSMGDLGTR